MKKDEQPPHWWIFGGSGSIEGRRRKLPDPPPWRSFDAAARARRGRRFIPGDEEIDLVNAALYLRRPLLITGKPGVGKTSLTYAVADDLQLGNVLRWSITTSTRLRDGLYSYDAIARLQDASLQQAGESDASEGDNKSDDRPKSPPPIGSYLRLGPLGTAFAASQPKAPRVLLIDEIDKSDIDLPNDLLHIFEEGEFSIPELERLPEYRVRILPHDASPDADLERDGILVERGRVHCEEFPLVIMTSNAEREFPPAFLRRCLKLDMAVPDRDTLIDIVRIHLLDGDDKVAARGWAERPADDDLDPRILQLVDDFIEQRAPDDDLAADQLLNAVYMVLRDVDPDRRYESRKALREALWRPLSG